MASANDVIEVLAVEPTASFTVTIAAPVVRADRKRPVLASMVPAPVALNVYGGVPPAAVTSTCVSTFVVGVAAVMERASPDPVASSSKPTRPHAVSVRHVVISSRDTRMTRPANRAAAQLARYAAPMP